MFQASSVTISGVAASGLSSSACPRVRVLVGSRAFLIFKIGTIINQTSTFYRKQTRLFGSALILKASSNSSGWQTTILVFFMNWDFDFSLIFSILVCGYFRGIAINCFSSLFP